MQFSIKNARLSFPSLFHKAVFNGEETKYEATLLLDKEKHADIIAEIKKAIAEKIKTDLKGTKLDASKLCLKDGDGVEYDGYENCYSLKASNNKRPLVINKDKSPIAEDDQKIYSGCYVNAKIELWAQNNSYGKRINANLLGVQFAGDGTPFGDGGKTASSNDFDVLADEDGDSF